MVTSMSENFEELLNSSFKKMETEYEPGDIIEALMVSQDDEYAYFDIGGKNEAIASINEFEPDQLSGEKKIKVFVVSTTSFEIRVTARPGTGFCSNELLRACLETKQKVFGKVKAENKAGYEITVGETSGFCPKSQLLQSIIDEAGSTSHYIEFIILEYKKNNFVLSNKALKAIKLEKLTEELKDTVRVGATYTGNVFRIEKFGLFVRLENDLEGLVPRSELSRSKLITPESFTLSDSVTIKIKSLDWDNNKHSFSIKDTSDDPWESIDSYYSGFEGNGTVSGFIKDGAFIEIIPGLEGFIHVSMMSKTKRIKNPEEILKLGQTVQFTISGIDKDRKRISLELNTDEIDPWSESTAIDGKKHRAIVEHSVNGGIIVRLESGLDAFIPDRELKKQSVQYKENDTIEIIITEIDSDKKRASASEKQVDEFEEQQNLASFISKQGDEKQSATASLGSMFGSVLSKMKEQAEEND
jgi:small subunit ribosomal protein S1